jgi:hypothetical protein
MMNNSAMAFIQVNVCFLCKEFYWDIFTYLRHSVYLLKCEVLGNKGFNFSLIFFFFEAVGVKVGVPVVKQSMHVLEI